MESLRGEDGWCFFFSFFYYLDIRPSDGKANIYPTPDTRMLTRGPLEKEDLKSIGVTREVWLRCQPLGSQQPTRSAAMEDDLLFHVLLVYELPWKSFVVMRCTAYNLVICHVRQDVMC